MIIKIQNLKIEEDVSEKCSRYYVRAGFMCDEFEASSILGRMVGNINLNINPFFLPLPIKRPLWNPSYYSYNSRLGLDLNKKEKLWKLTAIPIGAGLGNDSTISMIKNIIKDELIYNKNG